MRRYTCPRCRGTCRCGAKRPSDPLTSGHFGAALVIAVLFALGGTVRLLMWSLPHRSHWWAAILLVFLVTGVIVTRNRPVRPRN
jgi:hypothetical protein